MAGDGPTTAGSIVAKLKLDTSDWDAKLAAADAAARKLGTVDPSIRIDVDDNGAVSKMAAVDAAAKALSDDNVRLAQSTKGVDNANAGSVSRFALIAGAIAALIPLVGPLTGTIVGLSGALAGLGAAGVLGVVGVIQAMKQGTAVGEQYSAGLKELKSDLDALAQTAATRLLVSFQTVVGMIAGQMPALNSQLGWFSGQLGVIGTTTLQAVLTSLRILNPLFIQATGYVRSLAQGFQTWTANGGLQQFANFARQTFPQVTQALGSLVAGVVKVVEALAPLGSAMLAVLTAAGGLLQFLGSFGPVLSYVAAGALAAWGAFKLWAAVGPILSGVTTALEAAAGGATAFGIAIDAASGPIGWVVAGIGALVAVLGLSAASTQQAANSQDDYTAALQQSNGALDENIRKTVAKQLSDSGALQTAKQYHLQLSTVTDAVLGNQAAMEEVTAATNKYGQQLYQVHGYGGQVTNTYKAMSDKGREFLATVNGQSGSLKDSVSAFRDQKAASDSSTGSVESFKTAEDNAKSATDKFYRALQNLTRVNLDANQAQIQFQQSVADASTTIAKNGHTLDLTTQAGRDNSAALDAIASSALDVIGAETKQHASEGTLQATMAVSRAAFIKAAEAAGDTAKQAETLADKYGLIPKTVSTKYQTTGAQSAINAAKAVEANIAAVERFVNTTYSVTAAAPKPGTNIRGGSHAGQSAGGPIRKGMAEGGVAGLISGPGNAFNDLAGLFPLAAGEFVVSDRFKQATKYASTLSAMNRGASAMQVAVAAMAEGGVRFGGGQRVTHNHYHNTYYVTANDPTELTQKVSLRQNRMGVV